MSQTEFTRKSEQLQTLLEGAAKRLGRETGFVQRESKMTAAKFVQTLVLGVLENAQAGLNEWVQVSEELGVAISEQGLHERINEQAVALLAGLLKEMLLKLQNSVELPGPVLRQFSAIYVLDSTIVTLPASMQGQFAGFASAGSEAAVKVQLSYEYLRGNIGALELEAGRCADQACTLAVRLAQTDSLQIQDLGYFDQDDLAALDRSGSYFVSRLKYGTALYAQPADKQALNIAAVLQAQATPDYEVQLAVGARQRLPVRLLGQRLPEAVVAQRRRKAIAAARKKGHTCPQAYLDWLAWNLFITNTSPAQLSAAQVVRLYAIRWQIELIFKVWKSQAHLAATGTFRSERVLCSLYARLLALVMFHWLVAPYRVLERFELSLPKAFHVLQRFALRLLDSIVAGWHATPHVLQALAHAFVRFAAKNARRKHPSSYSRLLSASLA